jgi:hypothetical protein
VTEEEKRQTQAIEKLTSRELPLLEQAEIAGLSFSQYQQVYNLLKKYGLTPKQYRNLLDDQNGRCRICQTGIRGTYETERGNIRLKAVVDHDHGDGRVRGLLCTQCNSGLGFFKDSIRNLASAIVYLEDNGKAF